jgi:hypothetical protein
MPALARAALCSAVVVLPGAAAPPAAATLEYQVKAAFLLSFVTFTEWPAVAFESPTEPLRICVLGDDPFDSSLASTVQGERAGGHPITAERVARGQDAKGCHVLFVPRSGEERAGSAERGAFDPWTLIVGESPAMAGGSATITFAVDEGRVRFDVNRTAAERAGLRFSSKLLTNARVVR